MSLRSARLRYGSRVCLLAALLAINVWINTDGGKRAAAEIAIVGCTIQHTANSPQSFRGELKRGEFTQLGERVRSADAGVPCGSPQSGEVPVRIPIGPWAQQKSGEHGER